jgi:hypothetical protein
MRTGLAEMRERAVLLDKPDTAPWPTGSVDWIGFDDDIMALKEVQEADWKRRMGELMVGGDPMNSDGIFYNDLREPFISADQAQVTLATTAKALYTASAFPVLGGQYWSRVGKKIKIRLFGKITTAATPGNGSFDIYYGSGADATGTIIVSSAALALSATQTTVSYELEIYIHCRTTGSAGTLFGDGKASFNVGVLVSTLAPMLLPPNTAVVSGAVDLTAANIISCQFKRSGSTAENMWVQDMEVIALN